MTGLTNEPFARRMRLRRQGMIPEPDGPRQHRMLVATSREFPDVAFIVPCSDGNVPIQEARRGIPRAWIRGLIAADNPWHRLTWAEGTYHVVFTRDALLPRHWWSQP